MAETEKQFLLRKVRGAESVERLEFFGDEVKSDAEGGLDYTLDDRFMKQLRAVYALRQAELKTEAAV